MENVGRERNKVRNRDWDNVAEGIENTEKPGEGPGKKRDLAQATLA